jgi:hypothetical protein
VTSGLSGVQGKVQIRANVHDAYIIEDFTEFRILVILAAILFACGYCLMRVLLSIRIRFDTEDRDTDLVEINQRSFLRGITKTVVKSEHQCNAY